MRTIAQQGPNVYLILEAEDREAAVAEMQRGDAVARVFDAEEGILFYPFNAHSTLNRGVWRTTDLDDAETRKILAGLQDDDGLGIDEPWSDHSPRLKAEAA